MPHQVGCVGGVHSLRALIHAEKLVLALPDNPPDPSILPVYTSIPACIFPSITLATNHHEPSI